MFLVSDLHSGFLLCSNRITTTEHFKIKSHEVHGVRYNYNQVVHNL